MDAPQHRRNSRNGSPHNLLGQPDSRPHGRVSNKTIYGIALIGLMLFKFLMTWILGITPDHMLTTLNLVVGCVGGVLLILGRRDAPKNNV